MINVPPIDDFEESLGLSTYCTSNCIDTTNLLSKNYNVPITYNEVYQQLSDKSLPIVDSETWEKILPMLDSPDPEVIQLAFTLMQGYRHPPGVMNLVFINKAINTFLKSL